MSILGSRRICRSRGSRTKKARKSYERCSFSNLEYMRSFLKVKLSCHDSIIEIDQMQRFFENQNANYEAGTKSINLNARAAARLKSSILKSKGSSGFWSGKLVDPKTIRLVSLMLCIEPSYEGDSGKTISVCCRSGLPFRSRTYSLTSPSTWSVLATLLQQMTMTAVALPPTSHSLASSRSRPNDSDQPDSITKVGSGWLPTRIPRSGSLLESA